IMGIIVIVAGQAFSNSTKFRVRNQSMIEANAVAGNVGALLKDDIAQIGAKSAIDLTNSTPNGDGFVFMPEVYMDPENSADDKKDSSSFNLTKGANFDSLTVRRIQYLQTGAYNRVEEISWYVQNGILYRSCKTIEGTEDGANCPKNKSVIVAMADSVHQFKVIPSKPGVLETSGVPGAAGLLFPNTSDLADKTFRLIPYFGTDHYSFLTATPAEGGSTVSLSGFSTNYKESGEAVADPIRHMVLAGMSGGTGDWSGCKKIAFKKDSIYEISFEMTNNEDESRMFRAGIDHFAVGIRTVDDVPTLVDDVPDYYYYPPQNDKGIGTRVMRFSTKKEDFQACVAFTFAFFSPTVNMGHFSITNLQVRLAGEMNYVFDDTYVPAIKDKKNVRAFKVDFVVKKNGEAGEASVVIPAPSNGVRG
ncbi:MAG: hypothetical protein MJY78_10905, partial [Fibrobacter sp.]|nr:hypothetical protein [Fibrobacter sp.]